MLSQFTLGTKKTDFGYQSVFCVSRRRRCSKFSSASWEETSCWFRSSIVRREYSCRLLIASLVDLSCCRSPLVTSRKLRWESSSSSLEDWRSLFLSRMKTRNSLLRATNFVFSFFISSYIAADKASWLFFLAGRFFLLADAIFILWDSAGLCFRLD